MVGASCTTQRRSADGGVAKNTGPAVAAAADNRPQSTARAAVEQLLTAEQHDDHAASYAFVLHGDGQPSTSLAQWERARSDVPKINAFHIDSSNDAMVVATVKHTPGLDESVGLVAARERETWKVHRAGSGWLADQEADIDPVLPDDAGAIDGARAWFEAVQRCDQSAAAKYQAVSTLFSSLSTALHICGVHGAPQFDATVSQFQSGPSTADIVAQYTNAAMSWGRVVTVTAPIRMAILLAPIGDTWKVIGIADAS